MTGSWTLNSTQLSSKPRFWDSTCQFLLHNDPLWLFVTFSFDKQNINTLLLCYIFNMAFLYWIFLQSLIQRLTVDLKLGLWIQVSFIVIWKFEWNQVIVSLYKSPVISIICSCQNCLHLSLIWLQCILSTCFVNKMVLCHEYWAYLMLEQQKLKHFIDTAKFVCVLKLKVNLSGLYSGRGLGVSAEPPFWWKAWKMVKRVTYFSVFSLKKVSNFFDLPRM